MKVVIFEFYLQVHLLATYLPFFCKTISSESEPAQSILKPLVHYFELKKKTGLGLAFSRRLLKV